MERLASFSTGALADKARQRAGKTKKTHAGSTSDKLVLVFIMPAPDPPPPRASNESGRADILMLLLYMPRQLALPFASHDSTVVFYDPSLKLTSRHTCGKCGELNP